MLPIHASLMALVQKVAIITTLVNVSLASQVRTFGEVQGS